MDEASRLLPAGCSVPAGRSEVFERDLMSNKTASAARVYDRVARFCHVMEAPMDGMGGTERRRRVLSRATGDVLEIGVGTGINFEHYPADVRVNGIDISEQMLRRARERAELVGRSVELEVADVEKLPYGDATFDSVTATCVFCSPNDLLRC
jgi:phosphatidylethanolamine/phosphatidyl-N-methylethanolamine N-methyltransferase